MFSSKNERTALLISTILFALIGLGQLWRVFANIPVEFNGSLVPTWVSMIVGLVTLGMAFWTGNLLRHRRPLV